MRKVLCVGGLFLVFAVSALAQDAPKAEVSMGYSYLRSGGTGGVNFHGGSASIAGNVNDWLGVVGDFGGYHASQFGVSANVYTYLLGPRISYRGNKTFTPFAQVLVGGARATAGFSGASASLNSFAAAAGGGLDVKVSDRVAIRILQVEYLFTHFAGVRQNNGRASAGIVFRFGRK